MKDSKHKSLFYFLAIFILFFANFMGYPISGGEEQYLGFAKQWADPHWIKDSFSFKEFAGTRLVFQWLIYPFVTTLGIVKSALLLRFITYCLLAIPLSSLLRKLKIPVLVSLFGIQLFLLLGQNLFGGEWIIKTFEPKALSYVFVFFGINSFLSSKYLQTAVFLAIATYFHFLVGGWVLIILGLILLFEKKWKESIASLGLFLIILSPFVIYLFNGYFGVNPVDSGRIPSWIYCYYRLPHHTGIFKDYDFFIENCLVGVLLSIGLLVCTYSRKFCQSETKIIKFIRFIILSNLFFVFLAWVDGIILDQKASFLVKYYPFRTNSMALLLGLLIILNHLYSAALLKVKPVISNSVLYAAIVSMLAFTYLPAHNLKENDRDLLFDDIAVKAGEITKPGTSFAIIDVPIFDGRFNRFPRLAQRDVFVAYKFTPAEDKKLLEWYDRIYSLVEIEKNPKFLAEQTNYDLDHIISKRDLNPNRFTLLHENQVYKIYKLNK